MNALKRLSWCPASQYTEKPPKLAPTQPRRSLSTKRFFRHFVNGSEIVLHALAAIITADGFVPLYTEARKTTTVGSYDDIVVCRHNLEIPTVAPELADRTLRTAFTEEEGGILLVRIELRGDRSPMSASACRRWSSSSGLPLYPFPAGRKSACFPVVSCTASAKASPLRALFTA